MLCAIGFDVEDVSYPESDDAALWFAQFMNKRDIPATFFVTEDKIDVLMSRNRTDVINAMCAMDVGFHSSQHSRHPTIFELGEHNDHRSAVQIITQREIQSLRRIEEHCGQRIRVFGQPCGSYSPAMAEALSEHHIAYAYMPALLGPMSYLFWWNKCLVFPNCQQLPHVDDCLDSDTSVSERISSIDQSISHAKANKVQFIYFFAAHPTRTVYRGFHDDMLFSYGVNSEKTTESLVPYTQEEVARGRLNFQKVIAHLKAHTDLTLVSFDQVLDLVQPTSMRISTSQLDAWCATYEASDFHPVATEEMTAAEGLCALVSLLKHDLNEEGTIPRISPYGPPRYPRESNSSYRMSRINLMSSLAAFSDIVEQSGRLPSEIQVGNECVGIGNYARAVLRFARNSSINTTLVYGEFPFLRVGPIAAGEVIKNIRQCNIQDLHVGSNYTIEQTLLATWCLRPAKVS